MCVMSKLAVRAQNELDVLDQPIYTFSSSGDKSQRRELREKKEPISRTRRSPPCLQLL